MQKSKEKMQKLCLSPVFCPLVSHLFRAVLLSYGQKVRIFSNIHKKPKNA